MKRNIVKLNDGLEKNVTLPMDDDGKRQQITRKLRENYWHYVDIPDPESLTKIYNLFIFGNTISEPIGSIENLYFGAYYHIINKHPESLKKYYLAAIELKNTDAMVNLGLYYMETGNDCDNMTEKYYLMAVEAGSKVAITNLVNLYDKNGQYDKILELCQTRIEKIESFPSLSSKCILYIIQKFIQLGTVIKKQEFQIEELRFRPGGPGFEEVKKHFTECLAQLEIGKAESV